MKVIISTDPIQAPMTGIGEYTLRLIQALFAGQELDEVYGYSRWGAKRLTAPPQAPDVVKAGGGDGFLRTGARRARRLASIMVKRRALQRMGDVVYHEPNYLPAAFDGPTVVTVHDLSHLNHAECHPGARVIALSRLLPRALERAQAVITVSAFVAEEVQQTFGLPAARIHPIHHGVDPVFRPRSREEILPTLARYNLEPGGYLLCLATLEPRKNLGRLLSAFEQLPAALRRRYPLVLAGAQGWRNKSLLAQIDRLKAQGAVRYLGYVPAAHRTALYAGAHGFAYPALYEGFGLPPLEAMACGTPVLTANRSAMPEVAGQAALYVNPEDVDSITDGLHRICEDENLRGHLQSVGPAHAAGFTWADCAQRTAAVYRSVLP